MSEKTVQLSVPAEASFARAVRMTASALAVRYDMSVDDVEDVRMAAEEGFVYACATAPESCSVTFGLADDALSMDFSLGAQDPAGDSIEFAEVLLDAICDDFSILENGILHLVKRTGDVHDE